MCRSCQTDQNALHQQRYRSVVDLFLAENYVTPKINEPFSNPRISNFGFRLRSLVWSWARSQSTRNCQNKLAWAEPRTEAVVSKRAYRTLHGFMCTKAVESSPNQLRTLDSLPDLQKPAKDSSIWIWLFNLNTIALVISTWNSINSFC